MKRWLKLVCVLVVVAVASVGLAVWFTPAEAKGPCRCPQVYAPVECDHGKIYPNQCVADCHHARNCEPIGIL
jgi:hypothetical protein